MFTINRLINLLLEVVYVFFQSTPMAKRDGLCLIQSPIKLSSAEMLFLKKQVFHTRRLIPLNLHHSLTLLSQLISFIQTIPPLLDSLAKPIILPFFQLLQVFLRPNPTIPLSRRLTPTLLHVPLLLLAHRLLLGPPIYRPLLAQPHLVERQLFPHNPWTLLPTLLFRGGGGGGNSFLLYQQTLLLLLIFLLPSKIFLIFALVSCPVIPLLSFVIMFAIV